MEHKKTKPLLKLASNEPQPKPRAFAQNENHNTKNFAYTASQLTNQKATACKPTRLKIR